MAEDFNKYYILYDGECPFCNFWVQWLLKRDRKNLFLFSPLQSAFSQHFLRVRNLNIKDFDTVYLYRPGKFYYRKSRAAFEILRILGGPYQILAVLQFLPAFITDGVYDRIAKHRKRLAPNYCFVPTPEERLKFVEE